MLCFQSVELSHLVFDLLTDQRILQQIILCVFTSLTDLCALVCIPGTALLNDIRIGSEIKDITLTGDSFSEHNVKLGFFKWRRDLVLYDLYTDMVSDHLSALL